MALFFVSFHTQAQENVLERKISIQFNDLTVREAIQKLKTIGNVSFAYEPSVIPPKKVANKIFETERISAILSYILSDTNLSYELVVNNVVIKLKLSQVHTLHGIVYDEETGENLIGAKIQVDGLTQFSNQYGYFSISLHVNKYLIGYSYMGYQTKFEDLRLDEDAYRKIGLRRKSVELQEVNIGINLISKDSLELAKSIKLLDSKALQKLPFFGGEVDLIKALQTQAGVKNPSEGSSGMSVRGGGLDQNLILVDEAPVYNPSHLFGLISIFNSDAIKSVDFYSDFIPANFGGRLSSVVDTKLDEGNLTDYHLKGGVSLLSARLTAEGPIIKDKSSFLISARRSLTDLYNSGFSFFNVNATYYDLNFKSNYIFNNKNRIYLSVYHGFDHLFSQDNFANDWTNSTSTLRFNHIYNPRLFLNFSAIYSNYRNTLSLGNAQNWLTGIRDITFKADFTFFNKPGNIIEFGGVGTRHHFKPGETLPTDVTRSLNRFSALESALYFNQDVNLLEAINLKYGFRFGSFSTAKKFQEKIGYDTPTDYFYLEPRIQLALKLCKNQVIKLTYNRSVQNLQLIQDNEQAYSSLETWLPAGKNSSPQKSDYVATSYTLLDSIKGKFGLAVYYRRFYHLADLLDHSQIIQNPNFENQLRFGTGTAYGIELTLEKKIGTVSAEAIYTYSRTFRKIEAINNGLQYPTNYDTPNDLKININFPITDRVALSAFFNYQTGRAISIPVGFYNFLGSNVPIYEGKNSSRFPAFNRLDVSAVLNPKIKLIKNGHRKFESTWRFGVYNLYNRRNPLFYRINNTESDRNIGFEESFSGILPTFSYSFKF
ncbi:TonB-dependent receptor [Pedobacter sp. UYEF25]